MNDVLPGLEWAESFDRHGRAVATLDFRVATGDRVGATVVAVADGARADVRVGRTVIAARDTYPTFAAARAAADGLLASVVALAADLVGYVEPRPSLEALVNMAADAVDRAAIQNPAGGIEYPPTP